MILTIDATNVERAVSLLEIKVLAFRSDYLGVFSRPISILFKRIEHI